jgi:phosphatidylethanolamine/phosphatidyl-N-methylethanolamine N-methyltransferase
MTPDGRFIQFTYSPLSPLPRDRVSALAFHVEASPPVWLNLPPARVWVYRRQTAEKGGVKQKRPNPAAELFDKLKLGTEKIHLDLMREIAAAKVRFGIERKPLQPSRKGLSWGSAEESSQSDPGTGSSSHPE